ncbi:MAG: hypothetical protein ABI977_32015 [Acidobacteriota bacterium]
MIAAIVSDGGLESGQNDLAEKFSEQNKKRTVAQLRMASPKNHTQSSNRPYLENLFDVCCPPTTPVSELLPKLLKHCLSRYGLATTIPLANDNEFFFPTASKLLLLKKSFLL